jgi:hypothetical protein
MLSRLQVRVDECKKRYRILAEKIFRPKHGRSSGRSMIDLLNANGKFDVGSGVDGTCT